MDLPIVKDKVFLKDGSQLFDLLEVGLSGSDFCGFPLRKCEIER